LYNPFNLSGKACLVTGGSRGIGFAMASALAQAGADIILWSNNPQHLAEAGDALLSHGGRVSTRTVDVRNEEEIVAGMDALRQDFAHLDSVFACAGTPQPITSLQDMSDETYRDMLAVHLDGTLWTLRESCRQFISQSEAGRPGGSIIGISSLAATYGAPGLYAYAAAKGAIATLIRGIAVDMARHGVRANIVVPGWITTDLSSELRAQVTEKIIRRIPARRWGEAEELGGIAVYLASDASAYHSGDTLVIDGGYSVF
jgi:NAD(P)-dependent dehydrogenase (short-subunit alcohol dehydrogenase family)